MQLRITGQVVELIQILGTLLRSHMFLQDISDECWTVEHSADWGIPYREDPSLSDEDRAWADFMHAGRDEHEQTTYLLTGKACWITGEGKSREHGWHRIRANCEFSDWHDAGLSLWDIQIWAEVDDRIDRYHFLCHRGYGDDRDICLAEPGKMPLTPPRKIAFWREREERPREKRRKLRLIENGRRVVGPIPLP